MIWRGEIEGSYFVEIHQVDGYHGGTFATIKILDKNDVIFFEKAVYVNHMIHHGSIENHKEDIELWKKAAKDILEGDETAIWRCCHPDRTPWNPDGTIKARYNIGER